MKKFLRITADAVAAIMLLVMMVPLFLSLLLQIGPVQNAIVHKFSDIATRVVATPVTIERVNIRFPSHAVVEGFVVLDPIERDTLLGVRRIEAEIMISRLLSKRLAFGLVKVEGGAFLLNNDQEGMLNLKRVIDKIVNRNKPRNPKPFRMSIDRIEVDSFNFEFRRHDARSVDYGVNFQDMRFCNIHTRINDFSLVRDTISMNIERISLTEKSGLRLRRISADSLYLCPSLIRLDNARFDLEGRTTGRIRRYAMHFRQWAMADYINTVRMEADIERSQIDFKTISKFTGRHIPQTAVVEFSGRAQGTVADMSGHIERLATGGATVTDASFSMKGLPDVRNTLFSLAMPRLNMQSDDIYNIFEDFTGKRMKYSPVISRIGQINLSADFTGTFTDFESHGQSITSSGALGFRLSGNAVGRQTRLLGHVNTDNLDIGRILSVKGAKGLTMNADIDTRLGGDSMLLRTKGVIESFLAGGYNYHDIVIDGNLGDKAFLGYVGCDDPNLDFDFNGLIELSEALPRFNFGLDVRRADLALLGLNKRDSVSRLSGRMEASGYGNDIDNLNGNIKVKNLVYVNHTDTIEAGRISVSTRNNDESKYLSLTSDFADIELQGRQSYRSIMGYLKNTVRKYLPALQESGMQVISERLPYGRGATPRPRADTAAAGDPKAIDSYYVVRMNVKKANNVAAIFLPGLAMAEGTSLSFLFNPALNKFSLSLSSDYIMKGRNIVSALNIDSRNDADSISLFMRAGEIVAGNFYFPDVSLFGGIKNNSVGFYTRFENKADGSAAFIGSRTDFSNDPQTGRTRMRIGILPGYVRLSGQTWNIHNSTTTIDTTGIKIDNFIIDNDRQSIRAHGVISHRTEDTLSVRISQFDISPLSSFVDTLGYRLGGIMDGDIRILGLLDEGFFLSNIDLRQISINDHTYPDVCFTSVYDDRGHDIKYELTAADSLQLVTGTLKPSDRSYRAYINLPGVDLSVLSPMLRGISSATSGEADVSLVLTDKDKFPCLNGTVTVHDFSTTIDFTKVRYSVRGTATVKDNMVTLKNGILTDELGTEAPIEASVTHTRFKRANYRIHAYPDNMLCMNTTSRDNSLFFGRIFASGDMAVEGRGKAVSMVVNAVTQDQSTFNMPLSDKSTMTEADFISFVKPKADESLTRKLIRERDKKLSTKGVFDIKLNIDVRPNTYAQIVIDPTIGDIIKVRGSGQLVVNARPSTKEFTMYGGYEIEEGGYLFTLRNLINKYFNIGAGSNIKWTGDPLGADLDITATYRVKASLAPLLGRNASTSFSRRAEVDCNIHLTGQLLHPDVKLGIVVPNADPETQSLISSTLNTEEAVSLQLFWLLLANTFYADSSSQEESTINVGLANSAAVTGLEFLSNQIGNWISNDKFNLGFNYRPKDAMSSDELELSFSAPLLKDKLYLDAEGNVNFKNNTAYLNDDVGNLSGDASLTWILDKSGGIRTKAFTRQINTFDENQGLQESGVGVYYKEDFNRFGDVVRKFRNQWADYKQRRTQRQNAIDSLGRAAYRDSVRTERRNEREAARRSEEILRKARMNQ
ncbi:MAG: translocation/assembly module TamB [Rikenellaceae bacterium]|nr:translocation/assembly module TamB [Rikenellaceae bacterium]